MMSDLLDAHQAYEQECREWNYQADANHSRYSTAQDYFQKQINLLLGRAKDIVKCAEDDGGNLTGSERVEVQQIIENVNQLKDRLHQQCDNERLLERS
jgi:hypothetical protein